MTETDPKTHWIVPRSHPVANVFAWLSVIYCVGFVLWLVAFEPQRGTGIGFTIWALNTPFAITSIIFLVLQVSNPRLIQISEKYLAFEKSRPLLARLFTFVVALTILGVAVGLVFVVRILRAL